MTFSEPLFTYKILPWTLRAQDSWKQVMEGEIPTQRQPLLRHSDPSGGWGHLKWANSPKILTWTLQSRHQEADEKHQLSWFASKCLSPNRVCPQEGFAELIRSADGMLTGCLVYTRCDLGGGAWLAEGAPRGRLRLCLPPSTPDLPSAARHEQPSSAVPLSQSITD